ncbi:uncharacterized protein LOC115688610 [Syzygium oleosum]|uniref:uncharacterized protein LOC115688610 n=1 Tax=Syzygium oleosum TaxID=219896 RepID=UPI0011D1DD8B|nr:uncharacterized protein LOC115688610 [Syzygium oleosum]
MSTSQAVQKKYDDLKKTIKHHQKVLDDLVSVNSLFTFAVFVGISFVSVNPQSLETWTYCQADRHTTMTLLVNKVVSFACFLLSSLVATALKMHLSMYLALGPYCLKSFDWVGPLRSMMILLSTLGSILGCVYLTLSMVDVVRVLLGKLGCQASDTIQAAGSLVGIDGLALVIYVPSMMLAVYQSYAQLELKS